jgi:hypothetical protein
MLKELRELRRKRQMMLRLHQSLNVKDFLDEALSYETGTILKITIVVSGVTIPLMLFCTVNNGVLDDILFIGKIIYIPFTIDKNNINLHKLHLLQDQLRLIFHVCLWENFTIEPYYRINHTMLPLNNDVCGLIEKKLGESVTLERLYFEINFEGGGSIHEFCELSPEMQLSKLKTEKIIIRINPYDYKNFEVKFINMPEFKLINIDDLRNNIKHVKPNLPKILGYAFRFDSI